MASGQDARPHHAQPRLVPNGGSPIGATVAYDPATSKATLTPSATLAANTTYTAKLTNSVPRLRRDGDGRLLLDLHDRTIEVTSPERGASFFISWQLLPYARVVN